MKHKRNSGKQEELINPAAACIIATALAAMTAFLCLGIITIHEHAAGGPATLPQPPAMLEYSSTNLGALTDVASKHNSETAIQRSTEIRLLEYEAFWANFQNISKQRGWYATRLKHRHIALAIPAEDLPQLDPMIQDPMGWTNTHAGSTANPRGPNSLNIVSVPLAVNLTHIVPQTLWFLPIMGLGVIAVAATATAAGLFSLATMGTCSRVNRARSSRAKARIKLPTARTQPKGATKNC